MPISKETIAIVTIFPIMACVFIGVACYASRSKSHNNDDFSYQRSDNNGIDSGSSAIFMRSDNNGIDSGSSVISMPSDPYNNNNNNRIG